MALATHAAFLLASRRSHNCFTRLETTVASPNFLKLLGRNNSVGSSSLTNISTYLYSSATTSKCNGNATTISFRREPSSPAKRTDKDTRSITTSTSTSSSSTHTQSHFTSQFRISDEIREATYAGNSTAPVVALESAILTHGMPYPENIETALRLESIIRDQGVIPATVGVIEGKLTVGLTQEEIQILGSKVNRRTPVMKVSRRDLPYVLSQKFNGGTTVSGTIIAAVKAGIPIFATGGIGGVHRGAETTFDISADLRELGRNPIAVVSAGVKSILDIGKTLEYLETEGVCVCVLERRQEAAETKNAGVSNEQRDSKLKSFKQPESIIEPDCLLTGENDSAHPGIGRSKFPSFFTAESRFDAPFAVKDETQAAKMVHSAICLGLHSGILIAVPIPKEFEASGQKIEGAIHEALKKASRLSIQGRDMTPFLLGEINQLTQGESLLANKHLIENNVRVASKIATELAKLPRNEVERTRSGCDEGGGGNLEKSRSDIPLSNNVTNDIKLNPKRSFSTATNNNYLGLSSSSTHHCFSYPRNQTLQLHYTQSHRRSIFNYQPCTTRNLLFKTIRKLQNDFLSNSFTTLQRQFSTASPVTTGRPVVIGGTSLDLVLAIQEEEIVSDGRTHKSEIKTTPGGVARNMAEALGKLGHDPLLISAVGDDLFGREILRQLQLAGLDSSGVFTSTHNPTAIYSAVLNHKGECLFGLGDMSVHSELTPYTILQQQHHHYHHIRSAPIVVLDGNAPVQTMSKILQICTQNQVPVWFEPTEVRKAKKILQIPQDFWGGLRYISPNFSELESIMDEMNENGGKGRTICRDISGGDTFSRSEDNLLSVDIQLHSMVSRCFAMFTGLQLILFTRGKDGFLVISKKQDGTRGDNYEVLSFPPPAVNEDKVVSVSGAGDCLNAGFISGILQGLSIKESAEKGSMCAKESLQTVGNVPSSFEFLKGSQ